jgi:hypothetical protein
MIYNMTENIHELVLKDSSDKEELFDSDEDEVDNIHESDHNTETQADHFDVRQSEEEIDSIGLNGKFLRFSNEK